MSHEKGEYLSTCDNRDRPWALYVKQDKSDREKQVLHDITYMRNLKKVKPVKKQKVNWWLPVDRGGKDKSDGV